MPGSVETDQVMRLAGQSRRLMNELASELKAAGSALSAIGWSGARLGRHWQHLGGTRVVPYEAQIGKRTLTIDGILRFFDDSGRYLALNNPNVHEDAMFIAEHRPSWKWTVKSRQRKRGKSK
jgi:hypothetical protein